MSNFPKTKNTKTFFGKNFNQQQKVQKQTTTKRRISGHKNQNRRKSKEKLFSQVFHINKLNFCFTPTQESLSKKCYFYFCSINIYLKNDEQNNNNIICKKTVAIK